MLQWINTRFPLTDLIERHLSKYPAPTISIFGTYSDFL